MVQLPGRERLAQWIKRSKLDQQETAALIEMDPAVLSKILVGRRRPGLDNALKIERVTGIPVEAWQSSPEDEKSTEPATAGSNP